MNLHQRQDLTMRYILVAQFSIDIDSAYRLSFQYPLSKKAIDDFYEEKLEINRQKPFEKNEPEKGLKIIKTVLKQQLMELKKIVNGSINT